MRIFDYCLLESAVFSCQVTGCFIWTENELKGYLF